MHCYLTLGTGGGGPSLRNTGRSMKTFLVDHSGRAPRLAVDSQAADEGIRVHLAETSAALTNSARERERSGLRLRVLLSYHYYRDVDLFELFGKYFQEPWPDVFLDSGAFSAHTQGATIDIGAYAEWVQHHERLATVYANLDVIGDATGTARNQRELERRGLRPLPVFHTGEPWSVLTDTAEEYPYIALGGMVGQKNKALLRAWIAKCFATVGERAVFHGFGVTAWGIMRDFRWYSVDSSSWGAGFRFGTVSLFDEGKGKFVKIDLRDKAGAWEHRKLIESYGFTAKDLAIEGHYDRAAICAMSAMAYMRAEAYLRQVHGEVVIPEREPFRRDAGTQGRRDAGTQGRRDAGTQGRRDAGVDCRDDIQRERPECAGQAEVVSPQGGFCVTDQSSREREDCAVTLRTPTH